MDDFVLIKIGNALKLYRENTSSSLSIVMLVFYHIYSEVVHIHHKNMATKIWLEKKKGAGRGV